MAKQHHLWSAIFPIAPDISLSPTTYFTSEIQAKTTNPILITWKR